MERADDIRLQKIISSGKPIYSISRLDAINRCLYEAYITYILGERGSDNIYSLLGGRIHDVLEGITNNKNTTSDLLPAMQQTLEDVDILGLEFPKDRNGEDSIRQHWIEDMVHFCDTYRPPQSKKLAAEELFIYETPAGNILQGYIDLQHIRSDGSIDIYDYKTSSLYSGEAIKEHGRQLVAYTLGKEQEGYHVNSASWVFLKYAEIQYKGKKTARSKKETTITKVLERYKIGNEMANQVELVLNRLGFDPINTEIFLDTFKRTGRFDMLPQSVQTEFQMKPYVLKADISEYAKQECIGYIDSTIKMWEGLSKNAKDYLPKSFYKTYKSGKVVEDTFFCTQLCPHFRRCGYIKDFLDSRNEKTDENLF